MLRNKQIRGKGLIRSQNVSSPVLLTDCVRPELYSAGKPFQVFPQDEGLTALNPSYAPFVTDGFVSLPGGGENVPVKILRDTGASESFILESTLPFSAASSLERNVLVQGIALACMSVPLHKVVAGERVWPDLSPLPIVAPLSTVNLCDVATEEFPKVYSSCAVTRSKTKAACNSKVLLLCCSWSFSSPSFFPCRVGSRAAGGPYIG